MNIFNIPNSYSFLTSTISPVRPATGLEIRREGGEVFRDYLFSVSTAAVAHLDHFTEEGTA